MNRKNVRTGFAAAMGGAVLFAGLLVGASIALADDTDTEVAETTVDGDALERCHDFLRDRAHLFGGNLEEIAAELGSTLDEIRTQLAEGATLEEIATAAGVDLDAILDNLREEALAGIEEKVASGDLTREQADAIKERIEAFEPGEFSFGGEGFRGRMPHGFDFGRGFGGMDGLFGDLGFDLDLSELHDALESGMSLDEALESLGIDLDSVIADAKDSALAHIDRLVEDGTITQERADEIKDMIGSFEFGEGMPFGLHGFRFDMDLDGFDFEGFGGHHGHGFFGDDDGTADAEGALLDA